VEVWKAFSAQVLCGGSCGIEEKEGAGIQRKGSCNASAQAGARLLPQKWACKGNQRE